MKINKVLVFLLSLIGYVSLTIEANASCAFVSRDYSSRDNNRYHEGIVSNLKINSDFRLVSFVTSDEIENNEDKFNLKIPKQVKEQPEVLVRDFEKEYRLDEINLSSINQKFYTFNWSSCVIRKAKIDPNKLRFLAVLPGSQDILLPVIFGEGGKEYNFVFRTPKPTVIKSFQIKHGEQVIYRTSNPSQTGEISLTWDGRDESRNIVKAGLYNLFIEVEIRDLRGSIESYAEQISFYHNPNWLK